jgi:hypothetical protein
MTGAHLHFFIIQYVRDIIRQEGRNIGVMLFLGGESRFQALGQVDRHTADPEPFLTLSRLPQTAGWVYQEWVNWFHDLAENNGREYDDIERDLLALDREGSPFIGKGGGIITVDPEESPEVTLRELFERVVGKRGNGQKGEFLSRLSALVTSLNLRQDPGFMEDVEVQFLPNGPPPATVRASFLIDPPSGEKTVFKIVRTKTSTDAFLRQVNDAAHTFQLMVEHGFVRSERCIVLTEQASKTKAPSFDYLSSFAHVVTITDASAADRLQRILEQ